MKLKVCCPTCQAEYFVESTAIGRKATCSRCNGQFIAGASTDTHAAANTKAAQSSPEPAPVAPRPSAAKKLPEKIGRYLIRGRLGSGAFGDVYHAFDPRLDREVALKVPRPGTLKTPSDRERFVREAKAAGKLRHPNIVPVYDAEVEGNQLFITSAYIDGQTLKQRLQSGRLEFQESARIVIALAQALDYAHRQGIVHRDIKPANIMLDRQGEPLLMDFGLARLGSTETALAPAHDSDGGGIETTQQGTVMGTPAYMSPEQAAGNNDQVQGPGDQYSLGVVLFEMLCGKLPFDGHAKLVQSQHIADDPPAPCTVNPDVPRDLEAICLKTLSKSPDARYPRSADLALDLQHWLNEEPVIARRWRAREHLNRWARRNPYAASLALVAAVLTSVVFVVTVVAYWQTSAALAREAEQRRGAQQALREKVAAEAAKDEEYRQRIAALEQLAQALAAEKAAEKGKMEADIREQIAKVEADRSAYIDTVFRSYDGLKSGRDPRQVMAELEKAAERHRSWEWNFVYGLCQRGWRPNLAREISLDCHGLPVLSANGKWLAMAQTDASRPPPPQPPGPTPPTNGSAEDYRKFNQAQAEHRDKHIEEMKRTWQAQVAISTGRWSIIDLTADLVLLNEKTTAGIPNLNGISNNGMQVAGSWNGQLQFRTVKPGPPFPIPAPPSDATKIKYSPDLRSRAALVRKGRAVVIQHLDSDATHTWEVGTPGNRMFFILEFDDSGNYLLAASSGGNASHVRVWSLKSAAEVVSIDLPPRLQSAVIGDDGLTLAVSLVEEDSGSTQNHLEVWDLKTKSQKRRFPPTSFISYPRVRVFSPTNVVATNLPDGQIVGWSLESGNEVVRLRSFYDDEQSRFSDYCIFSSPDGYVVRTLGQLSQESRAPIWAVCDWKAGYSSVSQVLSADSPVVRGIRTWGQKSTTQRQYTSADGKYLVAQRGKETVLTDLKSSDRESFVLAGVTPVSYAFARSVVVSGSHLFVDQGPGQDVVQYDIAQRKVVNKTSNDGFGGHGGTIAYSPTTGEVVIPGHQRLLRWNPATNVRQEIPLPRQLQPCVVTPDGKRVIGRDLGNESTGSIDGDLLVFDVESGREVFRLPFPPESGGAQEIHLSDDGLHVVANCADRIVAWSGVLKSP